jgi:hypothetical protein
VTEIKKGGVKMFKAYCLYLAVWTTGMWCWLDRNEFVVMVVCPAVGVLGAAANSWWFHRRAQKEWEARLAKSSIEGRAILRAAKEKQAQEAAWVESFKNYEVIGGVEVL